MLSLDLIARTLADAQVVTAAQAARATAAAGGDATRLLDALAAEPADGLPGEPALTPHQRTVIRQCRGGAADLWAALRVGGYVLRGVEGQGGMGVVYKGWDPAARRWVAVKVPLTDDPTQRQRLRNEYQAMRDLDALPAVVRAFDLVEEGDRLALVMEYQNKGDLDKLATAAAKEGKPLAWRLVARWAAVLLEGLDAAHKRGYVHRDIKPKNVMIHKTSDREMARLSDWGIVRVDNPDIQLTGGLQLLGSAEYMPPEQWESPKAVVPASDLYALGGTLYFALTGKPPFWPRQDAAALCHAHLRMPPPSLRAARPDVPEAFDLLFAQMLHKQPEKRGTAGELRSRLQSLTAIQGGPPRPPSPPVKPPAPPPKPAEPPPVVLSRAPAPPPPPAKVPTVVTPVDRQRQRQTGSLGGAITGLAGATGKRLGQRGDELADSNRELSDAWKRFTFTLSAWCGRHPLLLFAGVGLVLVGLVFWAMKR